MASFSFFFGDGGPPEIAEAVVVEVVDVVVVTVDLLIDLNVASSSRPGNLYLEFI